MNPKQRSTLSLLISTYCFYISKIIVILLISLDSRRIVNPSRLAEIFEDEKLVEKIKRRLPYLFQLAELESSRAGKTGMEVGSLREKIIVALLMYKFGEANVETQVPITEPEVDVKLFDEPISIKTITGRSLSGVKLIWTVDPQKAKEFLENYYPRCDMLLVQINWNNAGGLYWFPLAVQKQVFDRIGREKYIKLPKPGTNPRGVEISKDSLLSLVKDRMSRKITIYWHRREIVVNTYKRWVDLWKEEEQDSA